MTQGDTEIVWMIGAVVGFALGFGLGYKRGQFSTLEWCSKIIDRASSKGETHDRSGT